MQFTENEVREISLSCMGYMVGVFDEINNHQITDSKWTLSPTYVRDKAIGYMNELMHKKKQEKLATESSN